MTKTALEAEIITLTAKHTQAKENLVAAQAHVQNCAQTLVQLEGAVAFAEHLMGLPEEVSADHPIVEP